MKNTFANGCCSLHSTTPPNSSEGFSISTTTGSTTRNWLFAKAHSTVNDFAFFSDILPMTSSWWQFHSWKQELITRDHIRWVRTTAMFSASKICSCCWSSVSNWGTNFFMEINHTHTEVFHETSLACSIQLAYDFVNYSCYHVDSLWRYNLHSYNHQPQFCHVWIKKNNHGSVFFPWQ